MSRMTWESAPPGYFTEPCRAWWGPDWRPVGEWGRNEVAISQAASRGRDTQIKAGYTGSVMGMSKLADAAVARYKAQRKPCQTE